MVIQLAFLHSDNQTFDNRLQQGGVGGYQEKSSCKPFYLYFILPILTIYHLIHEQAKAKKNNVQRLTMLSGIGQH
jgi:hypothetical protein